MPKLEVTQADRLAALRLRFGNDAPLDPLYVEWAEKGSAPLGHANPYSALADVILRLDKLAEAHAAGRAAGYAACQADVLTWLRTPSPAAFVFELHVANEIERGDHVGASTRAKENADA